MMVITHDDDDGDDDDDDDDDDGDDGDDVTIKHQGINSPTILNDGDHTR